MKSRNAGLVLAVLLTVFSGCGEKQLEPGSDRARFYQYAVRDADRMDKDYMERDAVKCVVFLSLESHETALRFAEEGATRYTLFKVAPADLDGFRLLLVRVRDDLVMQRGTDKKYTHEQGSVTTRASWWYGEGKPESRNEAVRLYAGSAMLQSGQARFVLWADLPDADGQTRREYYFMTPGQLAQLQENITEESQAKAVEVIRQHDVRQQRTGEQPDS